MSGTSGGKELDQNRGLSILALKISTYIVLVNARDDRGGANGHGFETGRAVTCRRTRILQRCDTKGGVGYGVWENYFPSRDLFTIHWNRPREWLNPGDTHLCPNVMHHHHL